MTSFWSNNSAKNEQNIAIKHSNDQLPSLGSKSHQALLRKVSSRTLYQFLPFHNSRNNSPKLQEIQSIHQRVSKKKQTIRSIHSRSSYRLIPKNYIEDPPIIQLSQAVRKLQDIFRRECGFSQAQYQAKLKKTLTSKTFTIRPHSVQNLLINNPKIQVKKQFEEIIKIFNKADLKSNDSEESIPKMINVKSAQKMISLISKTRSNEKAKMKFEESLTHNQKLQLLKQSRAFQKAYKHVMLKSNTTKILYHHLVSELYIETGQLQDALNPLYYSEYYARKMDFDQYVIPCLILQSEIKQSLYEPGQSIRILKTALEFSIVKKWKEFQNRILEKISMVYYYRGNSYMAKYYKDLSETSLPKSQSDIYLREYSKQQELKSLQAKIFLLPYEEINKKKNNDNRELDISRDLYQDHEGMIQSHQQEVSSMLRDSQTSKVGIKLRKLIIQNAKNAQVRKFDSQHQYPQIVPRLVALDYPIQNCSQIIKSHLSKSRSNLSYQIKNTNFLKTFKFLKSLYKRLNYEISHEYQEVTFEKENLPSIYS